MTEKYETEFKGLFERFPLKDRLLIRLSKYMPSGIRERIQLGYVPLLVLWAIEFGFKQAKEEMGDKAFQRMLDQIPTKIKDKDGVWILPSGTSQAEVDQFLMRLKEQGGKVSES